MGWEAFHYNKKGSKQAEICRSMTSDTWGKKGPCDEQFDYLGLSIRFPKEALSIETSDLGGRPRV